MKTLVKSALLAVVGLALGSVAAAQLTDAEFKCQRSVSQAGSRFVAAKAKCTMRCIGNAAKGVNPFSDCFVPYGGATAECIDDTVLDANGAEDRFRDAIRRACDPGFKVGADCPECYDGGDCSTDGEAVDRVQRHEGQLDGYFAGVFCDQPGADAAETACELGTAKAISKLIPSINKCYERCYVHARRGLFSQSDCVAPASDPATAACLHAADDKSILAIDKKCRDVDALPDCYGYYPDGASWTNFFDIVYGGDVPSTFCGSPSGAFLDGSPSR